MNIERAKDDITAAEDILGRDDLEGRPTLVDVAAYHVQQAAEKCLKHILHDWHGVDDTVQGFRTHNISSLLKMIEKRAPGFIAAHDDLNHFAFILTSWEAGSRYEDSACSKKPEVESALEMTKRLLDEIESRNQNS